MTAVEIKPSVARAAVDVPAGGSTAAPALAQSSVGAQAWPWAMMALAGLLYLCWAGSSYDPRKMVLWYWFYKPEEVPGLTPSEFSMVPGLGHLLGAWLVLCYALTMLAYRAAHSEIKSRLWQAVIGGVIFVVALDVRLAILRNWLPMVMDPGVIGARIYHPVIHGRGWAVLADMVTLGILLVTLYVRRGNMWMAALFAFHPLAAIESAANGSGISMVMPLLAVLAMGWRLQRWLRELLIVSAAALITWWLAHVALVTFSAAMPRPFDGMLASVLGVLGLQGRGVALALIVVEAGLQVAIVWQALRQGWSLAKTLGAMLVAWAVVTPNLMPVHVVPVVVLLVLEWNTAGWLLSGAMIGVYLMLGMYSRNEAWVMPDWLVMLMIVPAMVTLVEDWIGGWLRRRAERLAAAATPAK